MSEEYTEGTLNRRCRNRIILFIKCFALIVLLVFVDLMHVLISLPSKKDFSNLSTNSLLLNYTLNHLGLQQLKNHKQSFVSYDS